MRVEGARSSELEFRRDINGLRAIGVVAVCLFHFEVFGFAGGFVGVDVFFVISGFLMTAILSRDMASNQSVASFYWARLARLYPPMLVLLIATMALGYRLLAPEEFATLGRRAVAAVFSVANFTFYRDTSDYFAQSSKANWLLHLWSLAVECQFYLVFPLLLMVARRSRSRLYLALAIAFAASLALSIWLSTVDQPAAFYMMPARVWEFLAGSFAYLTMPLIHPRLRSTLTLLGIAFIAFSIGAYSETTLFPGIAAILPVIGTALVLSSPTDGPLLSNRVGQFFGKISYSLYLWHWPVWIAARHLDIGPSNINTTAFILISVALATISYRLVEVPSRLLRQRKNILPSMNGMVGLSASTAAIALYIAVSGGMPQRVPEIVREVIPRFNADTSSSPRGCYLMPNEEPSKLGPECFSPGGKRPELMVWGDSYAKHVLHGFATTPLASNLGWSTAASCPPFLDPPSILSATCPAIARATLSRTISAGPDTALLFARWSYYQQNGVDVLAQLRATISNLQAHGIGVVVIGPVPEWFPTLPQKLVSLNFAARSIPTRMKDPSQEEDAELDRRMSALAAENGVRYVSLFDLWCNDAGCLPIVGPVGGEDLAVYDYGHLTVTAANEVARQVFR